MFVAISSDPLCMAVAYCREGQSTCIKILDYAQEHWCSSALVGDPLSAGM